MRHRSRKLPLLGNGSLWLGGLALSLAVGCGAGTRPEVAKPAAELSAEEILARMASAYAEAKSYADSGILRVKFTQHGQVTNDALPFAVQFSRPNRIRISSYGAVVACDGNFLRGAIDDPGTNNVGGQFMERAAPDRLTLADFTSDTELYRIGLARNATARHPFTLSLLLGSSPLDEFLAAQVKRVRLDNLPWEGSDCYRVQAEASGGAFVFWVDRKTWVLRRLEFPTAELLADLHTGGEVGDISLAAEFQGASFQVAPAENTFALAPTKEATRVKYFVLPPAASPSPLLGKKIEEFSFSLATGGELNPAAMAGKIAVLVWFSPEEAHRAGVLAIDRAQRRLAGDANLQFAAISTEGMGTTPAQLEKLAKEWGMALPVALDAKEHGRTQFGIKRAPCVVILDGQQTPHLVELVEDSAIENWVVAVVQRLQKGENVAADVIKADAAARAQYERHLAAATAESDSSVLPLAVVEIAPRSQPQRMRLKPRWSCAELKAPGNILVTPGDSNSKRVLVLDGYRTVVELSEDGKVVGRHALPLPELAAVSILRSARNGAGRRFFAAGSLLGKQVFVFDEKWERVVAYPAADEKHDGIRDFQFADLQGDGEPELLLGFWNLQGVHGVGLDGKRIWSNRMASSAQSLAVSTANEAGFRKLMVVDERGSLVKLNHSGLADKPLGVEGRFMRQISAAQTPTHRVTPWLGLAAQANGTSAAIALDQQFREVWKLPFDVIAPDNYLDPVTSGPLFDEETGYWLVASAEGSITAISEDGQFVDRFNYGAKLGGLALVNWNGARTLLVSANNAVEAWEVSRTSDTASLPLAAPSLAAP